MTRFLVCALCGAMLGLGVFAEPLSRFSVAWIAIGLCMTVAESRIASGAFAATIGAGAYAAAGWWVPAVLSHLGLSWVGAGLLWGICILFCGVFPWLAYGFVAHAVRGSSPTVGTLWILFASLATEWLITLPQYGLPVFSTAYAAASDLDLMQAAVLLGAPGLSSILMGTGYALSRLPETRHPLRVASAFGVGWIALGTFGMEVAERVRGAVAPLSSRTSSLLLIQPQIPRSERWIPEMQPIHLGQLVEFSLKALADGGDRPDAIVWPENVLTVPIEAVDALNSGLADFTNRANTPLILGHVRPAPAAEPGVYRSAVSWLAPRRGPVATVEKAIAIPIVESSERTLLRRLLEPYLGDLATWPRAEVAAPSGPLVGDFEVGPLLCYEILFPRLVSMRRSSDTIAILNLADDGWAGSPYAHHLLLRIARFAAIQQRLPLARLTQGGASTILDEFGRTIAHAEPDRFEALRLRSSPRPPPGGIERISIAAVALGPAWLTWLIFPRFERTLRAAAWRRTNHRASES